MGLLIDYVMAQVTGRPCADAQLHVCARQGRFSPGTDRRADENGRHTFRAKKLGFQHRDNRHDHQSQRTGNGRG